MVEKFQSNFREEALELLSTLEESLLLLEENPENAEEISAVFRAMHTIKGAAAMFGYQHISSLTHEVEGLLDTIRSGKTKISSQIIDLTLECRDHIRVLLDHGEPVSEELKEVSTRILEKLHDLSPVSTKDTRGRAPISKIVEQEESPETKIKTFRIAFKPSADVMVNGTKPLGLLGELAEMGEMSSYPYISKLPLLDDLNCSMCYMSWDLMLTTEKSAEDIRSVFMFVEDKSEISIEFVDSPKIEQASPKQLGKILVERGIAAEEQIEDLVKKQRHQKLGALLVEEGLDRDAVKAALAEQEHISRTRQSSGQEGPGTSIRVSSGKLDILVDLVGELVTLQARLAQTSGEIGHSVLGNINESLERLSAELRDNAMSLRMLPIGTTFSKFKRLVRDLSKELGKEVDLVTEGAETELDKTVIERLNDPLVHLIRNSLDHGLEDPETRKSRGKNPMGTVRLRALHTGANVTIEVSDDGKGLNYESIESKALEKGLIASGHSLSEDEVRNLIFLPGFSTAKEVTKLSGRGVGLDVVKSELESLGGTIGLRSKPNEGTVFTLTIPLTLAIIEGLLVSAGPEHYVCPLSSIEECLELRGRNQSALTGSIEYRGKLLPWISLRSHFSIHADESAIEQVVVINQQGDRIGLVVDRVLGQLQTVIKSLGKLYKGARGLSGATILGDGSVALIIDVAGITASLEKGSAA